MFLHKSGTFLHPTHTFCGDIIYGSSLIWQRMAQATRVRLDFPTVSLTGSETSALRLLSAPQFASLAKCSRPWSGQPPQHSPIPLWSCANAKGSVFVLCLKGFLQPLCHGETHPAAIVEPMIDQESEFTWQKSISSKRLNMEKMNMQYTVVVT